MIAAGSRLDRPALLRRGLDLLGWLLDHETIDGHLSVTPAGGSGPGASRPAFDQQPIEVAALADACARAAGVDGGADVARRSPCRSRLVPGRQRRQGIVMWDPETGGGFDGLLADGANRNQGAESTLAAARHAAARATLLGCAAVTSTRAALATRIPQRLDS